MASQDVFPLARSEGPPIELVRELFRTATRNLHVRLADLYDVDVPVRTAAVSYSHLGDVLNRVGRDQGSVYISFMLAPSNLPGLLSVDGELLFRLAGLLLGEDPDGELPLYRSRAPSRVDMQIARRLALDVLRCIEQSAMPGVDPHFGVQTVGTASRPPTTMPKSAGVVEVSLDFGPPDKPYGLITLMLPARMSGILWPSQIIIPAPDISASTSVNRVLPLPVEVTVELARIPISLAKLRSLEPGSVLDLGPQGDVVLRVGNRAMFCGEAGERGAARCVRVIDRLVD
ncbi:MAG: flagellar motor switch protein FliM [Myxococcota bacterium]